MTDINLEELVKHVNVEIDIKSKKQRLTLALAGYYVRGKVH